MIPATIYIVKFEPSLMVFIFYKNKNSYHNGQLQKLHNL